MKRIHIQKTDAHILGVMSFQNDARSVKLAILLERKITKKCIYFFTRYHDSYTTLTFLFGNYQSSVCYFFATYIQFSK